MSLYRQSYFGICHIHGFHELELSFAIGWATTSLNVLFWHPGRASLNELGVLVDASHIYYMVGIGLLSHRTTEQASFDCLTAIKRCFFVCVVSDVGYRDEYQ